MPERERGDFLDACDDEEAGAAYDSSAGLAVGAADALGTYLFEMATRSVREEREGRGEVR
jgi:hypothetical protein